MKVIKTPLLPSCLLFLIFFLFSCQENDFWSLDTDTSLGRFYGRSALDLNTEVNLAPYEAITNAIEVQSWPDRSRIGILVYNEGLLTLEASGQAFVDDIYDITKFDTWRNDDGSWGLHLTIQSDSVTYNFTR